MGWKKEDEGTWERWRYTSDAWKWIVGIIVGLMILGAMGK